MSKDHMFDLLSKLLYPIAMTSLSPTSPEKLRVDIWSDIACPWCYIGKRRFEAALQNFAHKDNVEIVYHSFELDPSGPALNPQTSGQMLAQKYGRTPAQAQQMLDQVTQTAAAEGLTYDFDQVKLANTFLAHQLIQLAATQNLGPQMKERLLRAYFTDGANLSDLETLVALGADVGLSADQVRAALASGEYAPAVRQDEAQAQRLGISGVPFYVLSGKYGISGAQGPEVFGQALNQVWAEQNPAPLTMLGSADADGCEDGSCEVAISD